MRTVYSGLVDESFIGQTVTLYGWAHRRRDHGGLIFCDLRDREGITQINFDPEHSDGDAFKIAETMRPEWPIRVHGVVRDRAHQLRVRRRGAITAQPGLRQVQRFDRHHQGRSNAHAAILPPPPEAATARRCGGVRQVT